MKQVILKLTIDIADSNLTKEQIESLAIESVNDTFPGVLGDGEVWVNSIEAEVMQ